MWLTPWGYTNRLPNDYNEQVNESNIDLLVCYSYSLTDPKTDRTDTWLYFGIGCVSDRNERVQIIHACIYAYCWNDICFNICIGTLYTQSVGSWIGSIERLHNY